MRKQTILPWVAIALLGLSSRAQAAIPATDVVIKIFRGDTTDASNQVNDSPNEFLTEFSRPNCTCRKPYTIQVYLNGASPNEARNATSGRYQVVTGTTCSDMSTSNGTFQERCRELLAPAPLTDLGSSKTIEVTADQLSFDRGSAEMCPVAKPSLSLWVLIDQDGDQMYEVWQKKDYTYQGQAPRPPINLGGDGGNGRVLVSWGIESGQDVYLQGGGGFQILCAKKDGTVAFPAPKAAPAYDAPCGTTATVLAALDGGMEEDAGVSDDGGGADAATTAEDGGAGTGGSGGSGGTSGVPSYFANRDPAYVCSGLISSLTMNATVEGLENDSAYNFAVIAIDLAGNPSDPSSVIEKTPVLTSGGFSAYRNAGGSADGGCAISGRARTGSLLLLVIVGGLSIAARRRRRGDRP